MIPGKALSAQKVKNAADVNKNCFRLRMIIPQNSQVNHKTDKSGSRYYRFHKSSRKILYQTE
jgi:hypothetical protein